MPNISTSEGSYNNLLKNRLICTNTVIGPFIHRIVISFFQEQNSVENTFILAMDILWVARLSTPASVCDLLLFLLIRPINSPQKFATEVPMQIEMREEIAKQTD